MEGEFHEPWRLSKSRHRGISDREGNNVAHFSADGQPEQFDRDNIDRVIAAVNFLQGISTARLTASDPAACMFLAWLRGDEAAALAWADEVQERANAGEGYVSRADMRELLVRCTFALLQNRAAHPDLPPRTELMKALRALRPAKAEVPGDA